MSPEAPISAREVKEAVERFESAWQRGERPAISDYCLRTGFQSDALLRELVLVDFEYRLKLGQSRSAEDYVVEFPQLQTSEQAILKLLGVESRWKASRIAPKPDAPANGAADRSSVAADSTAASLETASDADLSVVAATRTSPRDAASDRNSSGETASGRESPTVRRLPTSQILGKFRLIDVVGQGGFGTVFRAIDTDLGRIVAVKVPREGLLATEKEQERFIREARSAAALRHPHIVVVYEVGGTRERPFIVSALVSGCALSKAFAARRFDPREAAAIVRAVAEALQYAHSRNVVHRDVKPSNIMLDDRGEPFLMDFGLAKRDGESLITVAGQILGTPAYMSPEQAVGDAARVDARTDIYSLGVVLYESLTGELPFQGNPHSILHHVINTEPRSPMVANRAIPRDLAMICLKCLQKLPDDRYSSAGELQDDLSRFLEGLPVRARPISPVSRGWRWSRRHPKTALLLVVAAALAAGLPLVRMIYTARIEAANQAFATLEEANRARLEKLFVSRGNGFVELGDPMRALPWFAAALDQASPGSLAASIHRVRLITSLEGPRLSGIWLAGGPINSVARCPARPLLAIAPAAKAALVLDLRAADARVLLPHPQPLLQCTFSPDGSRLAISGNDGQVRIWLTSALSGNPLVLNDEDQPTWMSFDPTGSLLASAGVEGAVRVWDTSTGRLRSPIFTHRATVCRLAFNADGSLLATACADGRVHLWSLGTRQQLGTLAHEGPVNCVGFAPASGILVSGSDDGTVRTWDCKSQTEQFAFQAGSPVLHLALSPDGNLISAGCRDGRVWVWSLKTRRALPGDFRHEQSVSALSFSKTGDKVVSGGLDQSVRIWDLKTGTAFLPPLVCGGGVTWVELSDDEQHLMAAAFDGIVRQWNLAGTGKAEHHFRGMGALSTVELSPNGRWLLVTGNRGLAQLCDLNSSKPSGHSLGDSSGTRRAAFAPDGKRLVLVSDNGDLAFWDVTREPQLIRLRRGTGSLIDVGFSPDGQSVVTANHDGTARVLSVSRDDARLTLPHGEGLKRVLFTTDGHRIYTAGGHRLCLWDSASGKFLSELPESDWNRREIDDCRLTPDGRFLLVVPLLSPAIVVNASTGTFLRSTNLHPLSVAFSNDGTRAAAIHGYRTASTWDMSTGNQVAACQSQRGDVNCCAMRGDGLLMATGSTDKTARLWDVQTGEPVSPPMRHSDQVVFVAFREAGNELVTVSRDAVIQLWTLDDGSPRERLSHLARATSGLVIDDNGSAVVLKPERIKAEWDAAVHAANSVSR